MRICQHGALVVVLSFDSSLVCLDSENVQETCLNTSTLHLLYTEIEGV